MKTCRGDGMLLKPSKPATPMDKTFQIQFSKWPLQQISLIEVWSTFSRYVLE